MSIGNNTNFGIDYWDILVYNGVMAKSSTLDLFNPTEVSMGDLVSRVPVLLKERGWGAIDLIRRGLAYNTAYRVARGETEITLKVAKQLCDIFELETLDRIFEYIPTKEERGH